MASPSSSSWGSSRSPPCRHKSLDSQEFGFASNLVDSAMIAPADQLFYKGQLLPLQFVDHRQNPVQALASHSHDDARLCCRNHGEVQFNSCRMESNMGFELDDGGDDKGLSMMMMVMMGSTDMLPPSTQMVDLQRSSSFRSEHSTLWESGPDKGGASNGESSASSSRDSDGSSQDSYFRSVNHHHKTESPAPTFAVTAPHVHNQTDRIKGKELSSITWRYLFRKAPRKYSRSAFSEDLSIYKVSPCNPPSLNEAKDVKPPLWKPVNSNRHDIKGPCKQNASTVDDGCLSKSVLSNTFGESRETAIHGRLHHTHREPRISVFGGSGKAVTVNATMASKTSGTECSLDENEGLRTKVALVRQRWQELYARKLKPLVQMKKGLLGQFKMDDCGKRASCQVESGSIHAFSRSSWPLQRRLSHQSSHKLITGRQYQEYWAYHGEFGTVPANSMSMLAISSCPPSSRSSPTHHTNQRGAAYNYSKDFTNRGINLYTGLMKNTRNKTDKSVNTNTKTKPSSTIRDPFVSSNSTSVSTKQELSSAVQSAIAHCKESYNRKLNRPD